MLQAPLGARKAVLDRHVAGLASGNPRLAQKAAAKVAQLGPHEQRYVQIETQKRLAPGAFDAALAQTARRGVPTVGKIVTHDVNSAARYQRNHPWYTRAPQMNSATPAQIEYGKTHSPSPVYGQPGFMGFSPEKLAAWNVEGARSRAYNAELEAIVNPFSGENLHMEKEIAWQMTGIPTLEHPIRSGPLNDVLAAASIFPIGKLGKVAELGDVGRAAGAAGKAATAGGDAKAAFTDVRAATNAAREFKRSVRAYKPRLLTHNDLTAQLQKPRSLLSQAGLRMADKASLSLQKSEHVTNVPGARLLTSGERVAKQAGRQQALEATRTRAAMTDHLLAIKKVKPGSPEDVANFWYAQLPKDYRNAKGLGLVRDKQAEELRYITSGQALENLNRQEAAIRAKLSGPGGGTYERVGAQLDNPMTSQERFALLKDLEEVKLLKTDLPQRSTDVAASIARLEDIMGRNIPANEKAIQAAHVLAQDRQRILSEAGRLNSDKAEARKGLVSRFVGLEPTGEEAYIGHRLPRPESFRGSYAPSAGVGRVASPQGMSENRLVLAKTGRLRQSLHVAGEDWHSAQVFRQSLQARKDLAALGEPFKGFVPKGHVLVNPKGVLIPAHWKTDELSQFTDHYEDIDHLRQKAEEIVQGFMVEHPADVQAMKDAALQGGYSDSLRVVPKRLADRYYTQFRSPGSRTLVGKTYDTAVDAVVTSLVFARIGYIPKNFVQNVIMALPHQGPFFLVNATKAAQAIRDTQLRHLLQGEVGGTGMTAALGKEAMHQKILGGITSFVSKGADDPLRMAAFMHEAAAEGVISKVRPLLNEQDRANLIRLLTDKSQRPLLNDIRSRSVEAMADFSRMTPTQKRLARRLAIIPGWLMAGSRYPFHFAATHPIRSALLAYIAMGEPGAPAALHFNHPLTDYLKGSGYTQGIQTPWGRLRTTSISPVSTPVGLAQEAIQTAEGKTDPFNYKQQTLFDEANPLLAAAVNFAQGAGATKSFEALAPNYKLVEGLIHPKASPTYPGDKTRLGRLERELGVIPVPVRDNPGKAQTLVRTTIHQLNVLNTPPQVRPLFTKAAHMDARRNLAKAQARKVSPTGKISEAESYRITMQTLLRNGMVTADQYRAAVNAIAGKTDREVVAATGYPISHWEYEAWAHASPSGDGWGPGKLLTELHSAYNTKVGK